MIRPLKHADYADARIPYEALSTGETLPTVEKGRVAFDSIIAHLGTQIIGAEHEGKIVSMATLHLLPNITYNARFYAVVENVVTHPDYQGQGWGRRVMETLAQTAWNADAYKIMLLTNQSRGARGFYEKLGYSSDEKHGMILRQTDAP